jgi:hypothetical protein
MANRESQLAIEALTAPDNAKARESQLVVEALTAPDNGKARVSQTVIEVLRYNTGAPAEAVNAVEVTWTD